MHTWVLVLVLHGYSALTTTNVEFPTEAGCTDAGKKVIAKHHDTLLDNWSYYICVEKK
jgi:hypothetical protein